MSSNIQSTPPQSPSAALSAWLETDISSPLNWQLARATLSEINESALAAGLGDLANTSKLLDALLEIAGTQASNPTKLSNDVQEIVTFVRTSVPIVVAAVECEEFSGEELQRVSNIARERWGDCLELFVPSEWDVNSFENCHADRSSDDAQFETESGSEFVASNIAEQINRVLTLMGEHETERPESKADRHPGFDSTPPCFDGITGNDSIAEMLADPDLRDAYLQDASRCLGAIEQSLLDSETHPRNVDDHRKICRELHTLKGASASVGLNELASYLHNVESAIEGVDERPEQLNTEMLLTAVDTVRRHVAALEFGPSPSSSIPSHQAWTMSQSDPRLMSSAGSGGDIPGSVRVRTAKLDRLMDMLAELVVLRNRRETQISELQQLNQELGHCAIRLKQASDHLVDGRKFTPRSESPMTPTNSTDWTNRLGLANQGCDISNGKAIAEVAGDLAEISRGIREFYRPIAEENVALTHFIRQFRQEMMQLRRLPMSGLFQRLQRSVRDAARAESKQVQIEFLGQQTAIEQSLQEQLFEPLLHIVRNAVSHGIEDAETRATKGKPIEGRLALQVTSSANLICLNVSDDGRGLDYDALRHRGYECGLLSADRSPTNQELAKLIFHPGFSTRDSTSQISGRGVGMDVVGNAMDRLHGRIDIDSVSGRGTTIRLSIPQRSGIEHAMIFRSGGQLFAVPMHSVAAALDMSVQSNLTANSTEPHSIDPQLSFAQVAKLASHEQAESRLLVLELDSGIRRENVHVHLLVNEIIGGEEVVVRGLPQAMKQHPFASGVTLSGGGAMVLMIDPTRFGELCRRNMIESRSIDSRVVSAIGARMAPRKVLVVDDSLSARMALVKRLNRYGLDCAEARDGMQALDFLRNGAFQLVITDLDMPRLGGFELMGEIRQREMTGPPVVVVSSRDEADIRSRAQRFGAQAFLSKPVSDESIARLLQQLNLT